MCKDGSDSFIPFSTESYFSTVTDWVFYPVGPFMPAVSDLRSAVRLLAEQGDGIDVAAAIRTATVRFDINGTSGLNAWTVVGTAVSSDGDSDPEDIDISTPTNGEFWVQPGIAIRKASGAGSVGQGQAGLQLSLPTERLTLIAGPTRLETISTPVGDAYAELWATEWRPFCDLQEVQVPYELYDLAGVTYKIVLQSVKTDPSQEVPAEDDIVGATTPGSSPEFGVGSSSSFTNATANKAQLCRIVLKAVASGSTEGSFRAWIAAAVRYA